MTQDYLAAFSDMEANPELTQVIAARKHASNLKWDRELQMKLKRKTVIHFSENYIRKSAYRPFVKTNCYADYAFVNCKYQQDRIFPDSSSENRVICVPSKGSKNPFSPLMTDMMSDLHFNEFSQCFPRYRYPKPVDVSGTIRTTGLLNISGGGQIVLITFQIQLYTPSKTIIATKQSRKTTSSITFTAFCTHPVIGINSQTTCQR